MVVFEEEKPVREWGEVGWHDYRKYFMKHAVLLCDPREASFVAGVWWCQNLRGISLLSTHPPASTHALHPVHLHPPSAPEEKEGGAKGLVYLASLWALNFQKF